jgi:hypothetical protein
LTCFPMTSRVCAFKTTFSMTTFLGAPLTQ